MILNLQGVPTDGESEDDLLLFLGGGPTRKQDGYITP